MILLKLTGSKSEEVFPRSLSYVDGQICFIGEERKDRCLVNINTSEIVLSLQNESFYDFEREIENSGDIGSILVYNPITEINLEGDGYLSFDGQDDYVDLGSNLLSGDGNFSISLWVKSISTNKVIMQQRNGGFNGEYQINFDSDGRINYWSYRNGFIFIKKGMYRFRHSR